MKQLTDKMVSVMGKLAVINRRYPSTELESIIDSIQRNLTDIYWLIDSPNYKPPTD